MVRGRWGVMGLMGGVLLLGMAGGASADSLEFVSYYPVAEAAGGSSFDRLHAGRATIGSNYSPDLVPDASVPNGMLFVEGRLGIGTADPREQVHLAAPGHLALPATAADGTAGLILMDGESFLQAIGRTNLFAGVGAGNLGITGGYNTGVGFESLSADTDGSENTAFGMQAMVANLTGHRNTAMGAGALSENESGNDNTAVGFQALWQNQGSSNTAVGSGALRENLAGASNTAMGLEALVNNTAGSNNTGLGVKALFSLETGSANTAAGKEALYGATGSRNTAVGTRAGTSATGDGNLFLGYEAGKDETGSNKLYIANSDTATPLIYGDFSANVAVVNDNLSVGTMTAPGAAPNTLEGNLRANDVYLRSTGQWLSQLGGGEQTRIGYYIGNGTASVNVLLGFEPRYVYIVEDQAASAPPFEMLESTQHYWVDHVASRNKSPRVWWSFPTSFQVKKAEYNRSGVRYYFIAYGGPERHFRFETD